MLEAALLRAPAPRQLRFLCAQNSARSQMAEGIARFLAPPTVVGVLVEVPVMLSVCSVCNRTRHWFPEQPRDAKAACAGNGGGRA